MQPAARPLIVPAAGGVVIGGRSVWRGFSVRETAGSPAEVRVWDNSGAAEGQMLATIGLAADASEFVFPRDSGIAVEQGLYCEVVTGDVEWVMFVSAETTIASAWAIFNDLPDDVTQYRFARMIAEWEGMQ